LPCLLLLLLHHGFCPPGDHRCSHHLLLQGLPSLLVLLSLSLLEQVLLLPPGLQLLVRDLVLLL
jgi:hypothetical protein